MKLWMLCISFLISANTIYACGPWYPYGEDIRFSLLDPRFFDNGGMSEFYYSANFFSDVAKHTVDNDRNVDDWYQICEGSVSKDDVFDAIYRLSAEEILDTKSTHPFVKKMIALGELDNLKYLAFAKNYSYLNAMTSDPWEQEKDALERKRSRAIEFARKEARKVPKGPLQRRYAFQAIRLAFYNNDRALVQKLYEFYFKEKPELTVDLWAQYYALWGQEDSAERNFKAAQLFAKTPSKRHGLFFMFNREVASEDVMQFATTNEEKANVLAMYSIRKSDRQLAQIQQIYALDPNNTLLSFLIVREVNKLEDWVLSPTYTSFAPVLRDELDYQSSSAADLVRNGVELDRLYAKSFLSWLKLKESTLNAEMFAATTGMLHFISGDAQSGSQVLRRASFKNDELTKWQKRMLGVLQIAASDATPISSIDLNLYLNESYLHRERFVFLLGRLFEFRNELGNAAILYAQLNLDDDYWNLFAWAEPQGNSVYNQSFYTGYFEYFDANYKATDVQTILDYAESQVANNTPLKSFAEKIVTNRLALLDLIGTKYLRQNELEHAKIALKRVPNDYWTSESNSYNYYLSANPFYADFYSEHNPTDGDTVSYTKYEIVEKLHGLIELAKTQQGDALAKTDFQIANCYFNMTTYGNSWMMRRTWWSANTYNTVYEDSDEFNKCILAQSYYLKASKATKTREFEALCIRMAGRCESYKLYFEEQYDYDIDYDKFGGFREYMFAKNKYYKDLKQKFPQWERELVTNCHSFNRFYRSI